MFRNNLKIAWRNLLKDRQFSFLNIVGLSTGLACTFLIYLWVSDELNVDKFNEHDNRLYQVMKTAPSADGNIFTFPSTPGLLAKKMSEQLPEIEYATTVRPGYETGILTVNDKRIRTTSEFVDQN